MRGKQEETEGRVTRVEACRPPAAPLQRAHSQSARRRSDATRGLWNGYKDGNTSPFLVT